MNFLSHASGFSSRAVYSSLFSLFSKAFILSLCLNPGSSGFADSELPESIPRIKIVSSPLLLEQSEISGAVSVLPSELFHQTETVLQESLAYLPNVTFVGGTSRPEFFRIRGVGELDRYEGVPNASIAILYDEVDLTGVGSATFLTDVERVEVFRGPQVVRFGASSLGGAVTIVPSEPAPYSGGRATLALGNDSRMFGSLIGNLQVSDESLVRFAVSGNRQDGFRDNNFLSSDSTNRRRENFARLEMKSQLSEDLRFSFSGTATELDNGYDAFAIDNSFITRSDRPGQDYEDLLLLVAKAEYRLSPSLVARSVSSVYQTDSVYSFDGDWGNNVFWGEFAPYDFFFERDGQRQVVAELLTLSNSSAEQQTLPDSTKWVLGFYAQHLDEKLDIVEDSDGEAYRELSSDYQSFTAAGFGQLNVPLSEKIVLDVGGRLEYRDQSYFDSAMSSFEEGKVLWGGQASLSYYFQERMSEDRLYLLLSRGFRAGGFNNGTTIPADRTTFDQEHLYNAEAGLVSTFFDDFLSVRSNIFYNRRQNQQIRLSTQTDPTDPLTFVYLTDNASRGYSLGWETEAVASLSDVLRIRLAAGLLDSVVVAAPAELASIEGRAQAHAPSYSYSVYADYQATDALGLTVGLVGSDGYYFDYSHNQKSDSYEIVSASLTYTCGASEVSLWARNLFDTRYHVRGFFFGVEPPDFSSELYVQQGDPLQFGLNYSYNF